MMNAMEQTPNPPRGYFGEVLDSTTYKRLLYHLLAFPLGLLYFVLLVVGISLGAGLLVIVVGAAVLLATLWMVGAFADLERFLGEALLGAPLPRRRAPLRPDGVWAWAKQSLSDAGTYKALLYLLLKFPFGVLTFSLGAALLGASLGLIAAPLTLVGTPGDWWTFVSFGREAQLTPAAAAAALIGGVALLVLSVSLLNLLARGWAALSVALLTGDGEGAAAQREVRALQKGARAVTFSGDLSATLGELLAQGVGATAAGAALAARGEQALAACGLKSGSAAAAALALNAAVVPPEEPGRAQLTARGGALLSANLGALATFVLPALAGEGEAGALHIAYPPGVAPSRRELAFWGAVADQAAVALETDRLLRRAHVQGTEQERARRARELHDSVAQALYGISLGAKTARAQVTAGLEAAESLDYVAQLADGASAEMKALLFSLRPDALEEGGLTPALTRLAEALRLRYKLDASLAAPEEPELPAEVKGALYRVAQEAAHNAVKHAGAHTVGLSLWRDGAAWILSVRDGGAGFDPAKVPLGTLGLKGMRERLEAIGATLTVKSTPGAGTTVTARVPAAGGFA